MRSLSRRGVTLIELLVTLGLMAVVSAMVLAVVLGASRVAARAATRLTTERTSQSLAALLHHDLGDAVVSDLAIAADAVRLPRPVGEGIVCAQAGGDPLIAREEWRGDRAPDAGRDRLRLLDAITLDWRDVALDAVIAASCPNGDAAWRLVPSASVDSPRVVRVVEPAVVRRYRSGRWEWFGLAPADGASPVQPFAGPVLPGTSRFSHSGHRLALSGAVVAGVRPLAIPLTAGP